MIQLRYDKRLGEQRKKSENPNFVKRQNNSSDGVNPNIEFLEKELTTLLGLKIEFTHKSNNSGKMSILYKS